MRSRITTLVSVCALCILFACSIESVAVGGDDDAELVQVVVSPSSETLAKDDTVRLAAVLTWASHATRDVQVSWSSANTSVATVSGAGLVRAIRAGTTRITARVEGHAASGDVTVFDIVEPSPAVAAVLISPSSATLDAIGFSQQLTAAARDANGALLPNVVIAWMSLEPALATVSSNGLVSARSTGTARIVAAVGNVSDTATVLVRQVPKSIDLSATSLSLSVGGTTQLYGTVKDAGGTPIPGAAIVWSSSAPSIASVTSAGLLTAVAAGTAVISASSGTPPERVTRDAAITVSAIPVASVRIDPASGSLLIGGTLQLTALAADAQGNTLAGRPMTWSSSNASVATVNGSGLVTGVAAGMVTITATTEGKSGTSSLSVATVPVATVSVSPSSANLTVGTTAQLTATARDASGNVLIGRSITWSSSDPARATVTSGGLVAGLTAGTATITALSEGRSGTAAVTIVVAPVASVTVSPSTASVTLGGTTQLSVVLRDAQGNVLTGRPITWSSSATSIATVTGTGLVSGTASGSATITATSEGRSGSATVSVLSAQSPVRFGIWIGKAELDLLPMSGSGWSGSGELKATADAKWTIQPIEQQSSQVFNVEAMAGALVFARLYPAAGAEGYRQKVVQAIRDVMSLPDDLSSSATAPNRNLGAWAISADLINLPAHDPQLDAQFRSWLRHKLDLKYQSSPATIREQIARPNNQGSWAVFSLAAASVYLEDRATLDLIARRTRRWLGDTSVPYELRWYGDQSWQMNPSNVSTRMGINPKNASRDGNNFDGLQPEDQARNEPGVYDPKDFPNVATTRYSEVSLEGILGTVLILHRAGYTDLLDASDQAILRGARWIKYAADAFPGKGYTYFTDSREASRPLINYFYGAGLPEDRTRPQIGGRAFGFAWTYWTHAGRRLR